MSEERARERQRAAASGPGKKVEGEQRGVAGTVWESEAEGIWTTALGFGGFVI